MKNSLIIVILVLLVGSSFLSSAQSFNLSGGMNFSSYRIFQNGERLHMNQVEEFGFIGYTDEYGENFYYSTSSTITTNTEWNTGFNASIGYEFQLMKLLSLETGLMYSTKGFTLIEEDLSLWDTGANSILNSREQYRVNYMDIPLVFKVGLNIGDFRLYAKAGGFAGWGLLGNIKRKHDMTYDNGVSSSGERREGIDLGELDTRFNYGFLTGIGIEYKSFFFEFKYSAGRAAITNGLSDKVNSHNLGLSIGFKFMRISE